MQGFATWGIGFEVKRCGVTINGCVMEEIDEMAEV
jgi:hypothetical protein